MSKVTGFLIYAPQIIRLIIQMSEVSIQSVVKHPLFSILQRLCVAMDSDMTQIHKSLCAAELALREFDCYKFRSSEKDLGIILKCSIYMIVSDIARVLQIRLLPNTWTEVNSLIGSMNNIRLHDITSLLLHSYTKQSLPQLYPPVFPVKNNSNKISRSNYPPHVTKILHSWLYSHISHPYPNDHEKNELMKETNLNLVQLNNWFINARRRFIVKTSMKSSNGTIIKTTFKRKEGANFNFDNSDNDDYSFERE